MSMTVTVLIHSAISCSEIRFEDRLVQYHNKVRASKAFVGYRTYVYSAPPTSESENSFHSTSTIPTMEYGRETTSRMNPVCVSLVWGTAGRSTPMPGYEMAFSIKLLSIN